MKRESGFLVTRRQRRGSMLANSAGLGECAEVYYERADAEHVRECMTFPNDWDVVEVFVEPACAPAPGEEGRR